MLLAENSEKGVQ